MASKLVIVESPAKAKTINQYLGSDYEVVASFGHVRDLPKSKLGVDLEKNFEPQYVIPTRARKVVTSLKSKAKGASQVYLATDLDREGEAIAWHIAQAVGLGNTKSQIPNPKIKRITFSEITKSAIQAAVANPREIDMDLVDAQQARRVLDRLVGYNLSPLLWKKVHRGLSAGRVQSVAVRLVVDREREIQNFKPVEYWSIEALLEKAGNPPQFTAKLVKIDDQKIEKETLTNEKVSSETKAKLENAEYKVEKIESTETRRNPYPPFTTSTLQQDASRRLGYSVKRTMRLAQILYEAGLITYMRTDSVNMSAQAVAAIRNTVGKLFGENYLEKTPRVYKSKQRSQEAHEAIRPSYPEKTPDELKVKLAPDEFRLYDLIWRRAFATQMATAIFDSARVEISAGPGLFAVTGSKIKFDGWLKIYPEKVSQTELPALSEGDDLNLIKLDALQHFTEPPARYSEAGLVKALEEKGIGRPSTYAPILSVIQDRGYVEKEERRLKPDEIGFVVNDLLVEHFPEIVNYDFTAHLEDELDEVADGKIAWEKLLKEFWDPFAKQLAEKTDSIEKKSIIEETDRTCPECKKPLVIRRGKFGKFYACTGFPDCKFTEPFLTEKDQEKKNQAEAAVADRKCPDCDKPLVVRRGKFGYFIGCSGYPECKHIEKVPNPNKDEAPASNAEIAAK